MTDEMKKLLEDAFRLTLDGLKSGGAFAKEQIPLVIQEKLTYDFYYYLFFTIFLTVVCVAVFSLGVFCIKKANKAGYDCEGWWLGGVFGTMIPTVVLFLTLTNNIPAMIQISVAPRLYIVEWLRAFKL